jgi:nucleoside-diphosphate-sugar epimerase
MNKVYITGTSGFVGRNLVGYIKNKYIIDSYNRQTSIINLEHCYAVIHLAGKAHDLKKVANPDEYYETNYELTKKLYDAFLQSDAEKFIFISSVKAAADSVEGILTENMHPVPETHYGKSKLLAEEYILGKNIPGKRVYILRPCMIHGPGNKGNLNLLYKVVSKGLPWPLGAFENKRSFLSVENLCFTICELIDRQDISTGVYQVADDEVISTNELITLIAGELGIKKRIWNISPSLIRRLAAIGDKLSLPLNSSRLQKLTESYVVSNQKLIAALNKKLPVSVREGLQRTINSFKSSK